MQIDDLKPAPYNPRKISKDAAKALTKSLTSFGDLSGIVFNERSGHLVCGHQRINALKDEFGDALEIVDDAIITPKGDTFRIRTVDWDDPTERVANIAANNPHIAGEFIQEELDEIIRGLKETEWCPVLEELRIDELVVAFDGIGASGIDDQGMLDQKNPVVCPECGHEFTP